MLKRKRTRVGRESPHVKDFKYARHPRQVEAKWEWALCQISGSGCRISINKMYTLEGTHVCDCIRTLIQKYTCTEKPFPI